MEEQNLPKTTEELVEQRGIVSNQLYNDGIINESLGNDHIGIRF